MKVGGTASPFRSQQREPAVQCSEELLDQIRALCVNGFRAFGHGGLEVGGVLYGVRDDHGSLQVLQFAELECAHAMGPGFVLSTSDHAAFERLLSPPPEMDTLGWFCSHTRRDLQLGPSDFELFDRYFPKPGAVALILKPEALGPARGIYFRRNSLGVVEAVQDEFLLQPSRRAMRQRQSDELERQADSRAAAAPPEPEPLPEFPSVPPWTPPPAEPRRRRANGRFSGLLWAAIGIAAIAAIWVSASRQESPKVSTDLGLHVEEASPGRIRIAWNRDADMIRTATSGTLQIRDNGKTVNLPMTAEDLRTSSATYMPQSAAVAVFLRVDPGNGAVKEESAEFVQSDFPRRSSPAKATTPPSTAPTSGDQPGAAAEDAAKPVAEPEPARKAESPVLEKSPATATNRGSEAERSAGIPPLRNFTPPPKRASSEQPNLALLPPPVAQPEQRRELPAEIPGPIVSVPVPAAPAAPAPSGAALVNPAPQPYSGPRSGRLVWTGNLPRRGVLEINGSRVNSGNLLGSLPGVPVTVRISPAEFREEGLFIYISDPGRNGYQESPSSSNGWNRTFFEFDRARASQIVLLESPGPSDHYSRLALRNDARNCTVIVIDWTLR